MAQRLVPFIAVFFLSPFLMATKVQKVPKPNPNVFDHQHAAFTTQLQKFVKVDGAYSYVNYGRWKKDRAHFDAYLNTLSSISKKQFDSWTQNQQMTFLINAYNGFAIKRVLDHYPVKSIRKTVGFLSSVFKTDFFQLLGEKRSLHWIEHDTLRPKYKNSGIHFAVNCAAVSCPSLLGTAFTPDKLDQQMQEQRKRFLGDTTRNNINTEKKEIRVSKIFDWFEEDFEAEAGSVRNYVLPYMTSDKDLIAKAKKEKWDVEFKKYKWDLNEQK